MYLDVDDVVIEKEDVDKDNAVEYLSIVVADVVIVVVVVDVAVVVVVVVCDRSCLTLLIFLQKTSFVQKLPMPPRLTIMIFLQLS